MSQEKNAPVARDVWRTRLKEARLRSGLSQKELGIRAGLDEFVASTRINRYEMGVHSADYELAVRLAKVLDVPVAFFYAETQEYALLLTAYFEANRRRRQQAIQVLTSTT